MKFSHIKFDEIESTQFYLKDHLSKTNSNENILVSTERQTAGVGRRGTEWVMLENCLAFSFSYRPNFPLELTSLAIGLVLAEFFKKTNPLLGLKWPNDLYIKGKKIGGIICHVMDEKIIVGVGINYGPSKIADYDFSYKAGFLTEEPLNKKASYHQIPANFYSFLLEKNLNSAKILADWNKHCCHLHQQVQFIEDNKSIQGIFLGIDESGHALIEIGNKIEKFLSGHLRIIGVPD
jgi:biotin-[acetyl-CoA-carboxylase] ligase BirA-like protein